MLRRTEPRATRNGLDASSPHKEPNNQDHQQQSSDPRSNRGTSVVVASTASEEKQQDQNDKNEVHNPYLTAFKFCFHVFSHHADLLHGRLELFGRQPNFPHQYRTS